MFNSQQKEHQHVILPPKHISSDYHWTVFNPEATPSTTMLDGALTTNVLVP